MYEVGKKRCDNKYNVWRNAALDNHQVWAIVEVFDSHAKAVSFVKAKNRRRNRPSYKDEQEKGSI